MKMIKMALLGGAAIAVSAASAQADDLDALKAQIETLNARVAAMETAPSVPAGYQLIAVSKGEMQQTPGLGMTAREMASYGNKATVISVLPTADAPAGTTITWSGYARAGLVYENKNIDTTIKAYERDNAEDEWAETNSLEGEAFKNVEFPAELGGETDDLDVKARGQIRVKASTDTAVGEVGVDIRLRGNFNGNGDADVFSDVAWGYWAMTPEVTFGGGYAGSLGNIGYGYDGACTCYYTDNADMAFNPGDTTQLRLSYGSGPLSMAVALEDGSTRLGATDFGASDEGNDGNGDNLGAAGEIKYSGDMFSGEIAAVWRGIDDKEFAGIEYDLDERWQVGAGVGFGLGEIANLSFAGAFGEGPAEVVEEGEIVKGLPYNQTFWGVSMLASMNLSDEIHAEFGAGYKHREGDDFTARTVDTPDDKDTADEDETSYTNWDFDGVEYDTYALMAGFYYQPVDQLTIGIEGEWYTTSASFSGEGTVGEDEDSTQRLDVDRETENYSIDLVSVWRF